MLDFDLCIMDAVETALFAVGFVVTGASIGALLALLGRHRLGLDEPRLRMRNFGLGCLMPMLLTALLFAVFAPRIGPAMCGYASTPDAVFLGWLCLLFPLTAVITFFFRVNRLSK